MGTEKVVVLDNGNTLVGGADNCLVIGRDGIQRALGELQEPLNVTSENLICALVFNSTASVDIVMSELYRIRAFLNDRIGT